MDEEIKEILSRLEYDKDNVYYVGYTDGVNIDNTLMPKDIKLLLDCMTNLQEENEELKYENNILKQELEKKKEECSSLIVEINPYQRYGISERDFH